MTKLLPQGNFPTQPEAPSAAVVSSAHDAADEKTKAHLKQLKRHHHLAMKATDEAFAHTVMAGVEVVLLKAETSHGVFTKRVRTAFLGIGIRSISRYRQVGEQYLTAAHGETIRASELRKKPALVKLEHCAEDHVSAYLQKHKLTTKAQLQAHASTTLPQTGNPSAPATLSLPNKFLLLANRELTKMNQSQREEVWQKLALLRRNLPPPESVPVQADNATGAGCFVNNN
jgi:hypothetical protein